MIPPVMNENSSNNKNGDLCKWKWPVLLIRQSELTHSLISDIKNAILQIYLKSVKRSCCKTSRTPGHITMNLCVWELCENLQDKVHWYMTLSGVSNELTLLSQDCISHTHRDCHQKCQSHKHVPCPPWRALRATVGRAHRIKGQVC